MTSGPNTDSPARPDGPLRAPFVILVVGLLAAGLAALLTLNTLAAADEVQARQLSSASSDNQDQVTQLNIDISAKQAPGVLASKAAALGMVPDPNPVFLSIAANGTVTILGTPQKVPAPVAAAPAVPTPTPTGTTPTSTTPTSATPTVTPAAGVVAPATTASPGAAPTPTPTPTPTPIATSTLPGGVR